MRIKPPEFLQKSLVQVPSKLPGEDRLDQGLNMIADKLENNPIHTGLMQLHARLPVLEEVDMNTPLGQVRLPEVSAPEPNFPVLDSRKMEAMKAAIGTDISSVIGIIPAIGDVVSDIVEDVFGEKIRKTLTPGELTTYMKFDKLGPSTYAMARTFAKGRK